MKNFTTIFYKIEPSLLKIDHEAYLVYQSIKQQIDKAHWLRRTRKAFRRREGLRLISYNSTFFGKYVDSGSL